MNLTTSLLHWLVVELTARADLLPRGNEKYIFQDAAEALADCAELIEKINNG